MAIQVTSEESISSHQPSCDDFVNVRLFTGSIDTTKLLIEGEKLLMVSSLVTLIAIV